MARLLWNFITGILASSNFWSFVAGTLASLLITHLYFVRQQKLGRRKQEKEVELCFGKVVDAYIKLLGKQPKIPFEVREAMAELKGKLQLYDHRFDSDQLMREAGEQAKKIISNHPQDFEN